MIWLICFLGMEIILVIKIILKISCCMCSFGRIRKIFLKFIKEIDKYVNNLYKIKRGEL